MNLRTTELSLRNGLAFMGTTKVAGLVVGNQRYRFVLNNPANSKRNMVLGGMVIDNNLNAMAFAALQLDPTNAPTTGAGIITNQNFDTAIAKSSIATIFADTTNTVMDGTNIANFAVPGNERTTFDEVAFILSPGHSLAVDMTFTALLAAAKADAMVYWAEEMLQ